MNLFYVQGFSINHVEIHFLILRWPRLGNIAEFYKCERSLTNSWKEHFRPFQEKNCFSEKKLGENCSSETC